MRYPDTAHWRDSGRSPKFFVIDAYSAFPLVLFLLHIRLWTFILALIICAFFLTLNKFGFTIPIFMRFIRSYLAGDIRSNRSWLSRKYR